NTRGYTDGAILEYDDHWFSVRFAEALMPKVANGIHLDADIARARSENLEFEATGSRLFHRTGTVRFLTYLTHANMGNYREALCRRTSTVSRSGRPGLSAWRWWPYLWTREDLRGILHSAHLARSVGIIRYSTHRRSGI